MNAYLIFGSENTHPLAWMLNKKHRHVWCIIADHDAGIWVSYNWHQGLPIVRVESSLEFDIANFYRDDGWTVLDLDHVERQAVQGPFILNNCVGHVKSVLGIGGWSVVPNQLFNHIKRNVVKANHTYNLMTMSGFGGGSVAPPPTHFSDGTAINPDGSAAKAPKSANTIAADKTLDKQKKLAAAQAVGGTSGVLLTDDTSSSDKGILK